MKMLTLVAALLATSAVADDSFRGGFTAGSLSASGFVSAPQGGSWTAGAMNESRGFAGVRQNGNGVETSTNGASVSEGFGQNFRGRTAAGGIGGGFGLFRARGRF